MCTSRTTFPLEARQAVQGLEGRFERVKVSPIEAPAPAESPQPVAGSSGAALPIKTVHHGQRVLETACEILARVHAIHLQAMHEMGSVWELDQTLARTLMAEFTRLQLIIGEDLTKSLIAFRTDLQTSCEVLLSDFARTLNLHPDDPVSCQVKVIIQMFHLNEDEPAPNGAGGSQGRHGGIPLELPLQNKLPIRVPGAN